MNSRTLLGLLAVVVAIPSVACGGAPASNDDESSGDAVVANNELALASGEFDGALELVVKDGKVSGSYFSSVGDPAHGGATCEFTLSGSVAAANGAQQSKIRATDGFDNVSGTLTAVAAGADGKAQVRLKLDQDLGACMRSSPVLTDANGLTMSATGKPGADIIGYRTVGSDKAFFYDAPGGHARAAFVLLGQTVSVLAAESNGFVKVRYEAAKSTTGFLKSSDLAALAAPSPRPTAKPVAAGKYIRSDGGWMLLVHGACSPDNILASPTGDTVASGPLGDDKHTLSSPEGDVCSGYALTPTNEPGVVMVTWKVPEGSHLGAEVEQGCRGAEGEYDMTQVGTDEACR